MAVDPIALEVGARALYAAFSRYSRRRSDNSIETPEDRWNRNQVTSAIQDAFRDEMRAALAALEQAGFTVQQRGASPRRF